jgi:hypothetical protein
MLNEQLWMAIEAIVQVFQYDLVQKDSVACHFVQSLL